MSVRERVGRILPRPARRMVKLGVRSVWTLPTSPLRMLPSFLIIGAQRAGTTSLYRYLMQHPAVLPVVLTKGAHYFDTEYAKGLAWYRAHFPLRAHATLLRSRFGVDVITGEGSPYYVFHPLAPGRVAETLPDVRLVLLLRDPVERAYSQHQHEVARGFEHLSFEKAIDLESERLAGERERLTADPTYRSFEHQHHSYLARGRYLEQILAWRERFPQDRLLILIAEEFFADPSEGLARVEAFLGLPPWLPLSFPRYNARSRAPMNPATRDRLVAYFRRPNAELARYLGRDLPWPT